MNLSKKALIHFFDALLWLALLFYLWGGGEFQGRVRFSHVNDVFAAIGLFYVFCRLSFNFRLSQTSFGRSGTELFQAFSLAVNQKTFRPFKSLSFGAALWGLAACYLLGLFIAAPIINYYSFGNFTYDLGIIENSIFNGATTGRFSTYYMTRGDQPTLYFPFNRLNFGLLPIAAIYSFLPRTEVLFILQSLALLSGLIPLFKLSDRLLPKEIPRWFPLLLYWCWDPIHRMNLSDFHETPFMIPFSLWFFYFLEKRASLVTLLPFLFLTAIWREDGWWVMAGMAFFAGTRTGRWKVFLPLALLGGAVLPIYTAFFNQVNSLSERYAHLGGDFHSLLFTVLSRPWIFLEMVWKNHEFLKNLFVTSGGAVFLFSGWGIATLILPVLELSQSEQMSYFGYHYVGLFAGPLFYTTLLGWKVLFPKLKKILSVKSAQIAVALSWVLAVTHFFTSEAGNLNYRHNPSEIACYESLLREIPPEVPVIAMDPFSARLAKRHWIAAPYKWIQISEEDWKDADLTAARWMIANDRKFLNVGIHPGLKALAKGKKSAAPWKIVVEGCGYYVAARDENY